MRYFLTKDERRHPFMANHDRPDADEVSKEIHDKRSKEIHDKANADRKALELSLKPQQEYEAKIQAELMAMAEERIAAKVIK